MSVYTPYPSVLCSYGPLRWLSLSSCVVASIKVPERSHLQVSSCVRMCSSVSAVFICRSHNNVHPDSHGFSAVGHEEKEPLVCFHTEGETGPRRLRMTKRETLLQQTQSAWEIQKCVRNPAKLFILLYNDYVILGLKLQFCVCCLRLWSVFTPYEEAYELTVVAVRRWS